jgi:ribosomal protein S27E
MTAKIFGYFDGPGDTPAFDPGTDVDCPVCGQKLSDPMRTPSFMVPDDSRSYFFRVHRSCAIDHPEIVDETEGMIVDAIYRSKESN